MKNMKLNISLAAIVVSGLAFITGCESGTDSGSTLGGAEKIRLLDSCGILSKAEASELLGANVANVDIFPLPIGNLCTYAAESGISYLSFNSITEQDWHAYTTESRSARKILESGREDTVKFPRLSGIGEGALHNTYTGDIQFYQSRVYISVSVALIKRPKNASSNWVDTSAAAYDCAIKTAKKIADRL